MPTNWNGVVQDLSLATTRKRKYFVPKTLLYAAMHLIKQFYDRRSRLICVHHLMRRCRNVERCPPHHRHSHQSNHGHSIVPFIATKDSKAPRLGRRTKNDSTSGLSGCLCCNSHSCLSTKDLPVVSIPRSCNGHRWQDESQPSTSSKPDGAVTIPIL